MNQGAREVFAPHLFDELSTPKKHQLNEEGRRLIFALKRYFRMIKKEIIIRPEQGFRRARRPKEPRPRSVQYNYNPRYVRANSNESYKTADCCDVQVHPTFVTAPCQMGVTREHARVTTTPQRGPNPNVTVDTGDLIRGEGSYMSEEEESKLNSPFENICLAEERSTVLEASVSFLCLRENLPPFHRKAGIPSKITTSRKLDPSIELRNIY